MSRRAHDLARALGIDHAPALPAELRVAGERVRQARAIPAPGEPGRFAALLAERERGRTKHRQAGRTARRAGESHEERILAAARRAGVDLRKMPTPVRMVGPKGPGGAFLAVYESGAGCDFRGVLPGGRALVMEAKGASTASLPLARKDGGPTLSRTQRDELEGAAQLGAVAGLLIRVQPASGEVWVWLPVAAYVAAEAAALAEGRRSLSAEAMVAAGGVRCEVETWPTVVGGGERCD